MDVKDITPENVAKAVGGTVERDGSILCCCPVHEASGTHNPSLVLTITDTRRILFHCRSQNCDAKHFQAIRDHLVKCGLPRSHVGGNRADKENRYTYQHPDGTYAWTKTRFVTKSGKKRFRCEVFDETTKQWSSGRPEGMPLLFNLAAVATVLATYPEQPLLIVEGEKDVNTAGGLGVLATTNADGAGKWRIEDTQTLIKLGVRKVVVCPDNDGPGIDHGIHVAKTFQQASIEVRWLELPGLGAKEDLSDWAPKQVQPDALLGELIGAAPLFDADALDWRSQLKLAGRNAGYSYRGDIHNMSLALRYEPRLKDCFAWNDFRHRVEVIRKTPWCVEEWWDAANLTPVGHRALHDADMAKLGNYLTSTYDFGPCPMQACRNAIHAEAEDHIFDELKDRIGALPDWDGVARLDGLLVTYAGADPQAHSAEYLALVGSKYIMQVLNRALNPGAKADYSWIFTALQGIGKDRVLETLFSPYYREGIPPPGINPADFARGIAGAIVAHAAEMSAWRKADVDERKATLTRCVDHGRPAYGYETPLLPTAHLLCFLAQRHRVHAGRDRRPPLLAHQHDPRAGRHRRAAPRSRPDPRRGAGAAEGRRAALADMGGGRAPDRPRTAEAHAGGGPGAPRRPGAVHRRGAAVDAAEPRGLRLEMAAAATTAEGVVPRRLLREMLRKLCGGEASGARPGLQEGHCVLHDLAPRERLAAGGCGIP